MAGWETKPLGEVCTIKPPKAEAKKKLTGTDEVSFAPMEDLGIGVKYLQPRRTRPLDDVSGSYTYFAEGDVLLAKITPCFENGKLGIARGLTNGVGFGSSEYIVLRPEPALDAEFLYYYLARPIFFEEGARTMTGAVGHKRVTKEFVESYPIPIPPLSEQQRIVAILDEAFEGVATAKANAEKNLQNARELFENYHQSVFSRGGEGWVDYRLGEIASFRNGINFTKQSKGRSVPIIGVKNFQNHLWAPLDDLDSVTLDGELSELDTLAEGDILSVRSNGNPELIGRCMLVGSLSEPITHSGFTIRIRLHDGNTLPQYVCQFLKSRDVRRTLIDGGNGANIRSLNQGTLSSVVIPLPPIEIQQRLINEIEAMHSKTAYLADIASRKLSALDELKKSLLHQAFTGQL